LPLKVSNSITGHHVCRVLDWISELRSVPASTVIDQWAYENGVTFEFIRLGKPNDNAHIESFKGSFRDECLNTNWFLSLRDAREKISSWRKDYNSFRPHSSLENMTPDEFREKHFKKPKIYNFACPEFG